MYTLRLELNDLVNVKICEHRTDPSKIVLKCTNPVGSNLLLEAIGVSDMETSRGGKYFISVTHKFDFVTRLRESIADLMLVGVNAELMEMGANALALYNEMSRSEPNEEILEKAMVGLGAAPKSAPLKLVATTTGQMAQVIGSEVIALLDKCPECGTRDNTHMNFCPNHHSNNS